MATYHFSLKDGKIGSAAKHCDYINREGRYAHGEMKEELAYKEAGNLPYWASSASHFFTYADVFERSNGNAYTEFEVALPAELSLEENIKLVHELVTNYIGNNKVYSFAIHEKMASLDKEQRQPHAHIMFSERIITDTKNVKYYDKFFSRANSKNPQNGGYKKDDRFSKNKYVSANNIGIIRRFWEDKLNEAYEKNGFDIKVSCETLNKQREYAITNGDEITAEELDRPAQVHLGPKLAGEMKRQLERADFKVDMLSEKAQIVIIAKKLNEVNKQIRVREEYIEKLRVQKEEQAVISAALKEEVKEQVIDITGNNLIQRIYETCTNISKRLQENNKKISETRKFYVRNDEIIKKMALSIYTNDATKQLEEDTKELARKKEKFNKQLAKFNEKPKPKIFDFAAKAEYNDGIKRLNKFKEDIIKKEAEIKYKESTIMKELAKPEHQEGLKTVRKTLYRKRDAAVKFIDELRKENKELSRIGKELLRTNNTLSKKLHYELPESVHNALKKNSNVSELQRALNDLQRTANKLRDAKQQGNNGMKVKLRSNENQNDGEGYDMGF